jgi:hypothetical protein
MKKNLNQVLIFSGSIALSLSMMFFSSLVSKETRYQVTETGAIVTEVEFKPLKKAGKKVEHNLTVIALFLALLSIPPAVLAYLIVANRLPELEEEAEEYNRAKKVRQIQNDAVLTTEKAICDANRKAAVTAHEKDVEKAFIEMGQESKWYSDAPPERTISPVSVPNTRIPVNPQQQALSASDSLLDTVLKPEAEKKTTLSDDSVDTFGVSEIVGQPTLTPGLLHLSEIKAREILNQLASSRKSLLLIAGTGGGKSVTQSALISILKQKSPQAEFWVVSQKNDNFCGLKEQERVTIFDTNKVKETLDTINHVWGIYNKRRHLDEGKRKNLSPVRLLLADWFSINLALEKLSSHPDVKASNYLIKLPDIVLNGRDFNVCLWADLQSFNLDAIGMNADNNSRQNFNLIGLGNYYTNDEGVNDSYGVLAYMIKSQHIVSDKNIRTKLTEEFEQLRLISKRNERPILFSTLEPPTICLQADIRYYQQQHQATLTEVEKPKEMGLVEPQTEVNLEQESEVQRLERIFKLEPEAKESEPSEPTVQSLNYAQSKDSSNPEPTFTTLHLNRAKTVSLIQRLRSELNQTQIIERLWECKKGGSEAWKKAYAQFKDLTKEEGNENQ